jgi:NAD(P)-dependent dehydrogenase (short-subunit alcohol dehydrogenase family)
MPAELPLTGATCVVTGAGRGIGRHIAETLARAGAALALCSRSPGELDQLARELGRDFGTDLLAAPVDVSEPAAVEAFALQVLDRFGRVDVLVNNAGVYGPVGLITEVDMGQWAAAVAVDLFGVAYGIHAFAPSMVAAGGGRIITMAGGGIGGRSTPSRVSAYTAAKSAVVTLTETVARELAPHRVWVNALAPGAISTSLIDTVIEAGPEAAGDDFFRGSVRQRQEGDSIEKVGEAVLFLATGRSGELTGKLISAKWDSLDSLGARAAELNASSLYTLRRIDGFDFVEQPRS